MEEGIFWAEVPKSKEKGGTVRRTLPPVPENDWKLPDHFPDLSSAKRIAIDIETYDPDLKAKGPGAQRDGYICGVSIGTDDGYREYFPIAHAMGENLDKEKVYGWLNQELGRKNQPKVGAKILYDLDFLASAGVKVEGPYHDVQLAEPLLNENAFSYSLETLSQKYLKEGKVEDEMSKWLGRAFGEKNIKSNIWQAPASVVAGYAKGDVDLPLRVLDKQMPLLEAENLGPIFDMECRNVPLLLAMRQRGVRVDVEGAEKVRDDLIQAEKDSLDEIKRLCGRRLNVNANGDLAKAFDTMGIEYPRTAKGAPSFVKEWLNKHPSDLARLITQTRTFGKMRGTFVEGYILDGHINGRIFSEFNQLKSDEGGAVSGRYSSSHPNLQNIPARDPIYGPLLRSLFIPEEGQSWWSLDWSQIEYRIIVHYANIMGFKGAAAAAAAYINDIKTDFHALVAEMTGLERGDAKTLNFGLAYGQGLPLLCFNLGVSREEGQEIIDTYHRKAPFIQKLSNNVSSRVRSRGYLHTLLGRRRRFDQWEKNGELFNEPGPGRRRAFMHKTLNALIQGSAADVMKKAMAEVWESGVCDVIGAPHLTVHDELDGSLDMGNKMHVEALAEIKHIMETCVKLSVPMIADGATGATWAEAK